MTWFEHAIWWHVYPLGFTGAPIRTSHDARPRLEHVRAWLDHALELGASGLLLGPVFASETHGYDSVDQYRIDPRLGDLADFDRLVAACKERGLRVALDGVFNHVGAGHPWVRRALAEGPDGEYARFFRIDWSDPRSPRPADFEGHSSLVALDHANPAVADHVTDVMSTWLDRGVDGWRLDAAYAVPAEFWAAVLPRVRSRHPDAWFLGEVIHGDYAAYAAASGIDSITQYELWKAIWSSLVDRNLFELDWALARHVELGRGQLPATFVGNHDVTRIATTVGPEGAVLALVVLMTVSGVPSVYYGDEQAFTGTKEERVGGDDAVRPTMPGTPAELAPWGGWMFRVHQQLLGLRRRHPWLVRATTTTTELTNTRYAYTARGAGAADVLHVELDLTDGHHAVVRDEAGGVLFSYDG
ncbi:alpha-amylase family protein [Cellulomonas cellasea]|uniref:Glycosidase n=1 Tax=Cellulomonas cellasea TaxID=43670 RepID=A0A7W4YAH9_9CELL|nr:alpha-amylase family protein [Cellulomonas cellasea]MBB2921802.1 glycosidase [Cellulomonas cellasea]